MWPLTSFQFFFICHSNIANVATYLLPILSHMSRQHRHTLAAWILYAFFDTSFVCLVLVRLPSTQFVRSAIDGAADVANTLCHHQLFTPHPFAHTNYR